MEKRTKITSKIVQAVYDEIDERVFKEYLHIDLPKLKKVGVFWQVNGIFGGFCFDSEFKDTEHVSIKLNNIYSWDRRHIMNTMCHEMLHYYCWTKDVEAGVKS